MSTQQLKVSPEETALIDQGLCPDCISRPERRAVRLRSGPRGGLAMIVRCEECGARFWVAPLFTPERIGELSQEETHEEAGN